MVVSQLKWFILTQIFVVLVQFGHGKQVAMKVVEEPSSYGMNFGGYQDQANSNTDTLKMRIPPANFSGPPHLRRLVNRCFSQTQDNYKYELCPFSNISQHEESLRYNAYNGILGVWQEWEIENNTFVAMLMNEGDTCGSMHRSTKVIFECGNKTEIGQVTEPKTCHYQLTLLTPLVCHPHAMLVYPTLSEELRQQWDVLETRLRNDELTQKGYKKQLRKLFEVAGYQLESSKKEELTKEAEEKDKEKAKIAGGDFDTLSQCSDEYKKLKDEVTRLKGLLDSNNIAHDESNKLDHEDNLYANYRYDAHENRMQEYEDYRDD